MSEESFLSDDFVRQLMSVGEVDVLVAIRSRNDRKTIGNVVRSAEDCLQRRFGRQRAVLVHVDAGSRDGTPQAAREASQLGIANGYESLRTLRWIRTDTGSSAGEEHVLRTVLSAAELLHAKSCAVVSASLESLDPAWIDSLLGPVHREHFDFVAPLYERHKFDGLLTRNLLYPFSRALFGKAMRELRATEFAFSGRLASHTLARPEWQNEGIRAGGEMWMALTAMSHSFRCCQTYLGPKPRATSSAGVVDVIRQSVSGFFWCLESTDSYWLKGIPQDEIKTIGPDHQLNTEAVRVDRKKLLQMYRSGVEELSQILCAILDPETHAELKRLAALDEPSSQMSNSLWARVSLEFAAAYHHSVLHRDHLVQAFVPVYRGRVCSFLSQHRSDSAEAIEADLEDLCNEFARQKTFFIERWSTKGKGET